MHPTIFGFRSKTTYHLTIELLQLVRLLRSIFNGLQSTFHSVQPILAVGLLKQNVAGGEQR